MKQRIRVTAIIRDGDKILVLKRNRGRAEAPVFWELPTGKIQFGEQPEEAINHILMEYTGLTATSIRLKDVITFTALEGASRLYNLYVVYEISVSGKLDPKIRYSAYKYVSDFNNAGIHLDNATAAVLEIENGGVLNSHSSYRDTASSSVIFVDGASRGNPGPSGIGYCVNDSSGKIIKKSGEFIGFTTSRSAEYFAMKKGIEVAISFGFKTARFVSDSLMVVNQLNGVMKPKNQDIIPVYNSIQELLQNFESVSFMHVPREENALADAEANHAIDNILKS